jgi:hypothetical protein
MRLTNRELAGMYFNYKHQMKIYKQRQQSLYNLNKYLEIKESLSLVKMEMKKRGIKKQEAKKLWND